jgi:hypothetical protein
LGHSPCERDDQNGTSIALWRNGDILVGVIECEEKTMDPTMRHPLRHRVIGRLAASLMLAIALGNGCTSYQAISLEAIRANPEEIIGKKARLHFVASTTDTLHASDGAPRVPTTPASADRDSTVWMRILELQYPIASGPSVSDAKMFGKQPEPDTVRVNLMLSDQIEVNRFDAAITALVVIACCLVAVIGAGVGYARGD